MIPRLETMADVDALAAQLERRRARLRYMRHLDSLILCAMLAALASVAFIVVRALK